MSYTDRSFVVTPSEICQSCHNFSGPKFALSDSLRDTYAALRTAIPCTEEERFIAKANVAYAQFEGASIEEEISRIQRIVEKLRDRRDALRRFEELERGLLSPIRRLPLEILQHIFQLVHSGKAVHVHSRICFPKVAAQVSSYWRSASHSCAPLWTNIYSGFGQLPKDLSMYGQFLMDYLQFSSQMPLSLELSPLIKPDVLGHSCVQAIVQSAHRWKEFHVMGMDQAMAIFSSFPKDFTFALLETLDLDEIMDSPISIAAAPILKFLSITGRYENEYPKVRIVIDSSPLLKHLRITNISSPSTSLTGLDWVCITQFVSFSIDYQQDEFATILESMPKLISLSCDGDVGNTRAVTLPSLEVLNTASGQEEANIVFDKLTTPRLKKLDAGWGFEMSYLARFARRSRFRLTELILHHEMDRSDALLRTPEFASVKTLYWKTPYSFRTILQWLTFQPNPSPQDIFPVLENLYISNLDHITDEEEEEWDFARLIDMLKSRLQLQGTDTTRNNLKYVQIKLSSVEDENVAFLRDFMQSEFVRSAGIQLDVSFWRNGRYRTVEV